MTQILENFAERPDVFSEYLDGLRLKAQEVHRATGRTATITLPGHALLILESGSVWPGETSAQFIARRALLINAEDPVAIRCEGATFTAITFDLTERSALAGSASIPYLIDLGDLDAEPWLSLSLNLLAAELDDPLPGGRSMIERILELVLIQALRRWSRTENRSESWLIAALDPHINAVLNAMHRDPARDWDLAELAARVNLSRSTLSAKFAALVGMPPIRYLAQLRLEAAARALTSTAAPIGAIAKDVGYGSEAAFSRAFSRHFGLAPKTWRARGAPAPPSM